MAYPDDIFLPTNSKEFGLVDETFEYNGHWDIVWSFTFALTGTEHAFATFLTNKSSLSTGYAGHYLGYFGDVPFPYLKSDPDGDFIIDNNGEYVFYEREDYRDTSSQSGFFVVAFDSTGLFALPISGNPGVPLSAVKPNALIVRDYDNDVVFNESLSNISTEFFLASSNKAYQTLRFRFSNGGKRLYIDYKTDGVDYKSLTSVPINFKLEDYPNLYPALTFCSPVSSLNVPSTMFIKNFHTQGNPESPTYERLSSVSLSTFIPSTYTTLSAVSAYKKPEVI